MTWPMLKWMLKWVALGLFVYIAFYIGCRVLLY